MRLNECMLLKEIASRRSVVPANPREGDVARVVWRFD